MSLSVSGAPAAPRAAPRSPRPRTRPRAAVPRPLGHRVQTAVPAAEPQKRRRSSPARSRPWSPAWPAWLPAARPAASPRASSPALPASSSSASWTLSASWPAWRLAAALHCNFTAAFAVASGFVELRPEAGRARSGCRLLRDPLEAACALGTGCLPEAVAAPAPSARPDVFFFDAAIPQGVRKSAPTLIAHAPWCQPRYQPKWLEIKGFATYHRRASFLFLCVLAFLVASLERPAMNIQISVGSPADEKADLLAIGCAEDTLEDKPRPGRLRHDAHRPPAGRHQGRAFQGQGGPDPGVSQPRPAARRPPGPAGSGQAQPASACPPCAPSPAAPPAWPTR